MKTLLQIRTALAAILLFLPIGYSATANNSRLVRPRGRSVVLNGLRFPIPRGYIQVLPSSIENSAFLYYGKYNLGIVLAVPQQSFVQADILTELTQAALNKFFPKEPGTFDWKQFQNHRKISKFESGGSEMMGFNGTDLFIVHSHRITVAGKDVSILDIFKWTEGDSRDIFERGLGAESMEACNDEVEIIHAVTHEKVSATSSPCELIAIPN